MISQGIYYPKDRWQDFYSQRKNSINLICLGSSHAYRSLNPFLMDSILGGNTFNLGSSGQSIQTAYYVLKNALRSQNPNTVVLEVYFYAFFEYDQTKNGGYNFDYIKWSRDKVEFLIGGFDLNESITVLLFPSIRYKDRGKYLLKKMLGRAVLPPRGDYYGKGFVRNFNRVKNSSLTRRNHFDDFYFDIEKADQKDILYLRKLKELCDTNGIRLIWVTAPIPQTTYQKLDNISVTNTFFQEQAKELGVPYYNYLDASSLPLNDTLHFMDSNHLNWAGANIFTEQISKDIMDLDLLAQ